MRRITWEGGLNSALLFRHFLHCLSAIEAWSLLYYSIHELQYNAPHLPLLHSTGLFSITMEIGQSELLLTFTKAAQKVLVNIFNWGEE